MLSLADLRHRHPRFFFDQVVLDQQSDQLVITLGYHFEAGPRFETVLTFPELTAAQLADKDLDLIRVWAAQIGMVEGLSYWKAACSPEWVVNVPGILAEQFPFWLNLLHKGLSEFFFIHQIDGWQRDFVQFSSTVSDADQLRPQIDKTVQPEKILLPVGGGKDSIVSSELLRHAKLPMTTFTINSYPQQRQVIETFWQQQSVPKSHLTLTRQLDPQILALNAEGYLNGHTPFNAMAAFVGTLACYLYGYRYFPVSNEWSANEGNTTFLGQTINHQYSKSIEFEKLFRKYQSQYLSTSIEYFSFLRPLHELQIAQLFTQYPQYWSVFLSCNRGQKKGIWCGECPKCLFVSTILAAFLTGEQLQSIFHQDILNKKELRDIFDQLTGFTEVKSLECVGTRDETRAAIALAHRKQSPVPALISYGWQKLLDEGNQPDQLISAAEAVLQRYMTDHCIPANLEPILQHALPLKPTNE